MRKHQSARRDEQRSSAEKQRADKTAKRRILRREGPERFELACVSFPDTVLTS